MKKRLIKIYNNRRLYDFHLCRYVEYHDLRNLVRDRAPFRIVDTKGRDVTLRIMAKVLAENVANCRSAPLLKVITNLVRRTCRA